MNPRAPIKPVHFGDAPIAEMLDIRGFNLNAVLEIDPAVPRRATSTSTTTRSQSFVFRANRPFDPLKLEDFLGGLIQVYGPDMLRYKGVLYHEGVRPPDGVPGRPHDDGRRYRPQMAARREALEQDGVHRTESSEGHLHQGSGAVPGVSGAAGRGRVRGLKHTRQSAPIGVRKWRRQDGGERQEDPLTEAELLKMPESAYMNEAQLAFFRRLLQQMEQDLLTNADETTEHLRETVIVPDPADRATIEEEHALELRTRDRERKLLKKVQQSLAAHRLRRVRLLRGDRRADRYSAAARPADRDAVARGAAAAGTAPEALRRLSAGDARGEVARTCRVPDPARSHRALEAVRPVGDAPVRHASSRPEASAGAQFRLYRRCRRLDRLSLFQGGSPEGRC